MTQILRQSTQVVVRIGPFVDVGDGFTPETGVTLSGADEAEALRAAGAATLDISAATWAAITGADGWYDLTLSTTATNTVGTLDIVVNDDSVCLPVFARFQVIEEAAYDVMYAAAAPGAASPTNITAGTITTATNVTTLNGIAANVITAASIAAGAIDAATFAADVDAEILSYIVDDATRIDASALNTASVTTIPAILVDTGTTLDAALAVVDANVDAILVDTGTTLQGELDGIQADTEDIQARLPAALTADGNIKADTLRVGGTLQTAGDIPALVTTVDTVVDAIKVQTDKLTFTVANQVDANVESVNAVTVNGTGAAGNEWGP